MSILNAILKNHFEIKAKRGWDKTYWFFDIHGTILKPNYKAGEIPKNFYPNAKEVLQYLTKQLDVCMILYTCSHPHEIAEYIEYFKTFGIHFHYVNENPEVPTDLNGYGCYDKKPYINVLFEDKCGFDPETEWSGVIDFMEIQYGKNTKN
jgi:hypothetical protein